MDNIGNRNGFDLKQEKQQHQQQQQIQSIRAGFDEDYPVRNSSSMTVNHLIHGTSLDPINDRQRSDYPSSTNLIGDSLGDFGKSSVNNTENSGAGIEDVTGGRMSLATPFNSGARQQHYDLNSTGRKFSSSTADPSQQSNAMYFDYNNHPSSSSSMRYQSIHNHNNNNNNDLATSSGYGGYHNSASQSANSSGSFYTHQTQSQPSMQMYQQQSHLNNSSDPYGVAGSVGGGGGRNNGGNGNNYSYQMSSGFHDSTGRQSSVNSYLSSGGSSGGYYTNVSSGVGGGGNNPSLVGNYSTSSGTDPSVVSSSTSSLHQGHRHIQKHHNHNQHHLYNNHQYHNIHQHYPHQHQQQQQIHEHHNKGDQLQQPHITYHKHYQQLHGLDKQHVEGRIFPQSGNSPQSGAATAGEETDRSSSDTSESFVPETRRFELKIVQHPVRVRVCGFGDKDRRPIDPPPVAKLEIYDHQNNLITEPHDLHFYVAHCSLLAENGLVDVTVGRFVDEEEVRYLMGSLVSSVYTLNDLDNKPGLFFVFPDLSVRMEGAYRLKIVVSSLAFSENSEPGQSATILCSAMTNVFRAYTAKKFPGMLESNDLMKHFARQGLKLVIRRDVRLNSNGGTGRMDDEDDDE